MDRASALPPLASSALPPPASSALPPPASSALPPPASSMPPVSQPKEEQPEAQPLALEDPYTFEAGTIVAVVQIRPVTTPGGVRPILVSVQNGVSNRDELPLMRLFADGDLGGPLPPAIMALLDELRALLPVRKLRQQERAAKKAAQFPSSRQATHSGGTPAKPATKPSKERPASPKPAASVPAPIPSQPVADQVVVGDIFADLN